jgi:spore coat polysaccharide biosynthesis predicted glycosyltransferase SpsG
MRAERLLIHTQASDAVGHGHVLRCLALADAARRRGLEVRFAAPDRTTTEVLARYGEQGLDPGSETPRWVIRDLPAGSPAASVRGEVSGGSRVLLLDDSGPARCLATLTSDAMMTPERARRLPHGADTRYLYGLEYAPLRREVTAFAGRARPGGARRLLVALGHGFAPGYLGRYLEALADLPTPGAIEILVSRAAPALRRAVGRIGAALREGETGIGAILGRADLVFTKLGMSQLEALAVGVGCLSVQPGAEHLEVQRGLTAAHGEWPGMDLGAAADVAPERAARRTLELLERPALLRRWGARARALVDGQGAARLLAALLEREP